MRRHSPSLYHFSFFSMLCCQSVVLQSTILFTMASFFENVALAPPNSILGVALECKSDSFPTKIDLTLGAYRNEEGLPMVLPSVRDAEKFIFEQKMDHEYLSQDGLPEFNRLSQLLMFGEDSPAIKENRVFSMQGLSGTGSLRLAADFIAEFMPSKTCYIPGNI